MDHAIPNGGHGDFAPFIVAYCERPVVTVFISTVVQILVKCQQAFLQMILELVHFFAHPLALGKSVEEGILGLIEQLVMAKNAPKTLKTAYLLKASGTLEVLTLKIRLVLELKLMNETRVFQLQAEAQEIGRMLGGWLKSSQSQ